MIFGNLFRSRHDNPTGPQMTVDSHCHILPGVDDGISSLEDSLAVLGAYETLGINEVWLTPHIMEDVPNSTQKLREVYCTLCEAYKGPIKLHLAAENMIDALFESRLRERDLLPHKDDHLLVETSYFSAPMNFREILKEIQSAGYTPILAHPERYDYMETDDYRELAASGIKLQLNLLSLTGFYGKRQKEKAEMLCKERLYSYIGSDLHRVAQADRLRQALTDNKIIRHITGIQAW